MRILRTSCLAAAGLLLAASSATAQATDNDPSAGSPSGTIYEIPLDRGRDDAAPRPRENEPDPGRGLVSSPIRSENGFSSSSTVPGAPAASASDATAAPAASGAPASAPDAVKDRAASSERGALSKPPTTGPRDGGLGADRERAVSGTDPAVATVSNAPSLARVLLLLGLAAGVAAGLGVAARQTARRR